MTAAAETVFFTRAVPSMVSWVLGPAGDGSRTVTVWTWPDGPDAVQSQPFQVASYDAARAVVPDGAWRVENAPLWFAEEVWFYDPMVTTTRRASPPERRPNHEQSKQGASDEAA